MSEAITYAKAGGPPDNWQKLVVLDGQGDAVRECVEVNAEEGWARRHVLDGNDNPVMINDEYAVEKITGKFTIKVRP